MTEVYEQGDDVVIVSNAEVVVSVVSSDVPPVVHIIESIETGPPGTPDAGREDIFFSWGDAPTIVYTADIGKLVYSVKLIITEGFDGADPVVEIGDADDHDRLLSSSIMDITAAGTNEVFPNYAYAARTDVNIYITPGAGGSHGAGRIIIAHQD